MNKVKTIALLIVCVVIVSLSASCLDRKNAEQGAYDVFFDENMKETLNAEKIKKTTFNIRQSLNGTEKKTKFSLEDLNAIIADCEKKYFEYDIIEFDKDIFYSEKINALFQFEKKETLKSQVSDIKTLSELSYQNYDKYLSDIYRMVLYQTLSICSEDLYAIGGDDEKIHPIMNYVGYLDNISVLSDLTVLRSLGYDSLLDLWNKCDLGDRLNLVPENRENFCSSFLFDSGRILYCDRLGTAEYMVIFPTAAQQATLKAIEAREGIEFPK